MTLVSCEARKRFGEDENNQQTTGLQKFTSQEAIHG